MKHFLTASAMLCSFLAAAQFPNLPYNPDENGDGLIGVVDLQGLLANYGNEFASAVISEDGESAIVYMGEMAYPSCAISCKNLPGFWTVSTLEDLGLVWGELTSPYNAFTWLEQSRTHSYSGYRLSYLRSGTNQYETVHLTDNVGDVLRCYCAAKQLPRVEYDYCRASGNNGAIAMDNLKSCIDAKLQNGWQLLGPSRDAAREDVFIQAFWRWAE